MSEQINKCCKCILEIKQRLISMYRDIQDKQTLALNPIVERINQLASKVYGQSASKLQPYVDRLDGLYDKINTQLVNKLNDIAGRSAPLIQASKDDALRPPWTKVMQDYWDSLVPPEPITPIPEDQPIFAGGNQSRDKPGPLIDDKTRPSTDMIPLPKPKAEGKLPEPCPDPKVFGLYCCPYTEINLMLDPELKKKRDDQLKDFVLQDTQGSMKEAAIIVITEEMAEETV